MRKVYAGVSLVFTTSIAIMGGFTACSASNDSNNGAGGSGNESTGSGGSGGSTAPAGAGGGTLFDGGGVGGGGPCVNLECQQVSCPGGGTTTVSGVVVAPTPPQYGEADPIYNAIVYVPNGDVEAFPDGVSCDKCGAAASGSPLVVTLTDAKGQFKLENVPVGANIPLVIQIGRWRRQVVVPEVAECVDTPLPKELTRLPRSKAEGDIPRVAIASSPYDAEECILRKIGIEDAEFTDPAQDGRVHIYAGDGATLPGSPPMANLWGDLNTLKKYDMVLFPCSSVASGDAAAFQNVFDYANAGGRVFATDLSYPWFKDGPKPFPSTAQGIDWTSVGVNPLPSLVDQTFPKGQALAEWLQYVGATQALGQIDLHETYHVVDAVIPPTTRWLYSASPATVQTLSFNTPVGVPAEDQCGRAVYSNFHVANGFTPMGTVYPAECNPNPLTPQEKVLEFLLFDLASCVQEDKDPPIPPPH
ncbi:MAG: carboxypeptidase regulatory-like domain-containing protein [Polyangiaceae bacterium]|nr:carboxypeptidase regulatory-like domain-containing protein [Polyangiaceae bacterium]